MNEEVGTEKHDHLRREIFYNVSQARLLSVTVSLPIGLLVFI